MYKVCIKLRRAWRPRGIATTMMTHVPCHSSGNPLRSPCPGRISHLTRIAPITLIILLIALQLFTACDFPTYGYSSSTPTATATQSAAQSTPTLNAWQHVGTGVDIRYEDWKSPNNEDVVTIVRFDPHHIHLTIGYQPTDPLSISDWMQQEQATAVINGGYFDKNNQATGLLVSDGQMAGTSYDGYGGMLYVDGQGGINLRSLRQQPYDPTEQLEQATQATPMLMIGGQRTQFQANATESRRSVVAMDKQGNLLFIASPDNAFSLDELADLLASSDLSLQTALNLDGGASTALDVKTSQPADAVEIDSITTLPIVIVVKAS